MAFYGIFMFFLTTHAISNRLQPSAIYAVLMQDVVQVAPI